MPFNKCCGIIADCEIIIILNINLILLIKRIKCALQNLNLKLLSFFVNIFVRGKVAHYIIKKEKTYMDLTKFVEGTH